jgi:Tol biopolymer transport system component
MLMKILPSASAALLLAGPLRAQVTELVSLGQAGVQGNDTAILPPPGRFVSSDGRFIAWMSDATNLVPGDTNLRADVFVRDRVLGTTERVSVGSSGNQGNGHSGVYGISISRDGRYVAFESASNNLEAGDTNGAREVFLRDRVNGTTERIALSSSGAQGNDWSYYPSLSADARFIAFGSEASNLVSGDSNALSDIFVRDRLTGTTERVSISTGGTQANGASEKPEISADGRFVVFGSAATNLVPGDTNGRWDVFVHDRLTGTTEIASISTTGIQGDFDTGWAWISADGRKVTFVTHATTLVPNDTNGCGDVFVRDRLTGTTERVSVGFDGSQGSQDSAGGTISDDGRYVLFEGASSNFVPGDTNNAWDMFVRDLREGTTERVSLTTTGAQVTSAVFGSISSSSDYVVFLSDFDDVAPGDSNGLTDMFIHERFSCSFASLCSPGLDGVLACPCSNPPSGPGRGCDNSSATGGASISGSGNTSLSHDTLVLTTADQRWSGTSILLQAPQQNSGIVFGQGIRCTGGLHRRLFVKQASGGGIVVPGPGDPSLSARSAALGDPIAMGSSRYYLVHYRDPFVLGGCNPALTWNVTNTGAVYWYW